MHKILTRSVHGLEMHKFGLPYYCAAGIFSESNYEGSVDLMLAAVDCFPDVLHPVSYMKNGHVYNRFVEGASFYKLFYGNSDPEIEFTNETSMDDYEPGELEECQRRIDRILGTKPTFAESAAIQWQVDRFLGKRK